MNSRRFSTPQRIFSRVLGGVGVNDDHSYTFYIDIKSR